MAGKTGYRAHISLGGVAVTEADNIEVTADGEEFDVSDLGDYLTQKGNGALDLNVSGEATVLTFSASILSRLHGAFSGTASFAIAIHDPADTVVLSGAGFYNKGGLTFPRGASKQPFGFHVNSITTAP